MAGRFEIALKKPIPIDSVPAEPEKKKRRPRSGRFDLDGLEIQFRRMGLKNGDLIFLSAQDATQEDIANLSKALDVVKERGPLSKINFSAICSNYDLKAKVRNATDISVLNVHIETVRNDLYEIEELKRELTKEVSRIQDKEKEDGRKI